MMLYNMDANIKKISKWFLFCIKLNVSNVFISKPLLKLFNLALDKLFTAVERVVFFLLLTLLFKLIWIQ